MIRKILILSCLLTMFAFAMPHSVKATGNQDLRATDFNFDLRPLTDDRLPTERYASEGINYIIRRLMSLAAGTIGGVAVLAFSAGGFMVLLSAGREGLVEKGKALMQYSLLGILFVLGAYVLVIMIQTLVTSIFSQY